nr:hypothetical protein [Intrasporangium sp.]
MMRTTTRSTSARIVRRAAARVTVRLCSPSDRGDVPGWVLITLMTAGLVTLLWAVAGDQLEALFTDAIGSVSGPSGP